MYDDSQDVLPVVYLARVVRARWWLVVAAVIVGAVAGFASAERRVATYGSSADVTLLINPLIWHTDLSLYKPVDPGAMDHELLLADGVESAKAVGKQLGVAASVVDAAVTAVPIGGQSLRIVVSSTDRSLARRLLPAVLDQYKASRRAELRHALAVREDALRTTATPTPAARAAVLAELGLVAKLRRILPSGVDVTRGPTPVQNTISPNPLAATALGAALGALAGGGAALVLAALPGASRRRWRTTE